VTIKLSICIPTYNFGEFIGQTLDSIIPQLTNDVELIVLDSNSIDNTFEQVTLRMESCPQLSYYKKDFRGGIDADIESIVSLSKGKYCWLFSADDLMYPNAVKLVLNYIHLNHDIYLNENILCSLDMKPLMGNPPLSNIEKPTLFDTSNNESRSSYFRSARSTEAFFSFLAGPIFKKTLWDEGTPFSRKFFGNRWIVAAHLLEMLNKGVTIFYLNKVLLQKRGDNDSFMELGLVNRMRLAIIGFRRMGNSVFGIDSIEAKHIRRCISNDLSLKHLLNAKLFLINSGDKFGVRRMDQLVTIHYSDIGFRNKVCILVYKNLPIFVLIIAKKIKYLLRR
jgi:abequosyltransferase